MPVQNFDEVKSYIEKDGCILVSESYKNTRQKLEVIGLCGHKYSVSYNDFKQQNAHLCKPCALKRRDSLTSLNYSDVKIFIESKGCILKSTEYINSETDLEIIDNSGHIYYATYHEFRGQKRYQCPNCGHKRGSGKRKLNFEDVKKEIEDKGCKLVSTEYISTHEKLEIFFACGHKDWRNLSDFRKTNPICSNCAPHVRRKIEIVKKEYEDEGYQLLEDSWNGAKNGKTFIDKCGYKYFISYGAFKTTIERNGNFEKFGIGNPYSIDNIKLWIKENNKKYDYVNGEFVGCNEKTLKFHCSLCDKDWLTSWALLYIGGEYCPDCNWSLVASKIAESRVTEDYNLAILYPDLMEEWDYDKNEKDPYKKIN
jgi:hypothetical protein